VDQLLIDRFLKRTMVLALNPFDVVKHFRSESDGMLGSTRHRLEF